MITDWTPVREAVIVARQARVEAGKAVLAAVEKFDGGLTERAGAKELSIPRSTLRGRISRFKMLDVERKTYEFFTSEAGIIFIQRITDSILLFGNQLSGFGLRLVESVLRTSGLDRFVACSASYLGNRADSMGGLIADFEKLERPRLSAAMPFRFISTLGDETWLDRMHLVAMESISSFILVEEPAERRDGETWNLAVCRGLEGFNVKIAQVTSDEGKGLLNYTKSILGVNHSPDLFHIQREISRGMAASLAAQIRSADKAVSYEEKALAALKMAQQDAVAERRGQGRPVDWAGRISVATQTLAASLRRSEQAVERQKKFRECLRGMSEDYHPVDMGWGTLRLPRDLEKRLQARFFTLHDIIREAQLPEYASKAVEKAERVLSEMVTTLSFVHGEWERFVENLEVSSKAAWQIHARLLPAAYLERIAATTRKDKKKQLFAQAAALRKLAFEAGTEIDTYSKEQRDSLMAKCSEQSYLFQRSSSPLEGRNGRLSQMYSIGRGISSKSIKVLTILSNYLVERPNGTTAAERFFGKKPLDLVEWVFARMPVYAASRKTILAPMMLSSNVLVN